MPISTAKVHHLICLLLAVFALAFQQRSASAQPRGIHPLGVPPQIHDSSTGGPVTGLEGMAITHDPRFEVIFDRQSLDFLTQGIGQENCVSVPITNRGDQPRKLLTLTSKDPKHFKINAPAMEMMPMMIAPHQSLLVSICFQADKVKEYKSLIVANLDVDTTTLQVKGVGIKPKPIVPVPTELALIPLKSKRRSTKPLSLEIPTRSSVSLEIDDLLGKTVRHILSNDLKSAGVYQVDFDWRDDQANALPAGHYYARLQVQGIETHKSDQVSVQIELKP